MATLADSTLVQINSSAEVLALAKSAGFTSIQAFMPGLQMFWNDVSSYNPRLLWSRRSVMSAFD
jgi:hypothetical protein